MSENRPLRPVSVRKVDTAYLEMIEEEEEELRKARQAQEQEDAD